MKTEKTLKKFALSGILALSMYAGFTPSVYAQVTDYKKSEVVVTDKKKGESLIYIADSSDFKIRDQVYADSLRKYEWHLGFIKRQEKRETGWYKDEIGFRLVIETKDRYSVARDYEKYQEGGRDFFLQATKCDGVQKYTVFKVYTLDLNIFSGRAEELIDVRGFPAPDKPKQKPIFVDRVEPLGKLEMKLLEVKSE